MFGKNEKPEKNQVSGGKKFKAFGTCCELRYKVVQLVNFPSKIPFSTSRIDLSNAIMEYAHT
jgi:hypothetical protein